MCHFKLIFWRSFKHGKTKKLLWPVNAIDQHICMLHNQLFYNNYLAEAKSF
jgi:hypothetical protein